MSGALHDIRARYAAAPLFDDDLTRQLNDYERRTGSITHTLATGRSSPPGGAQQSVGPFRSVQQRASSVGTGSLSREHPNSVGGATVWKAQVAQLPPEIQRPAAVEWLLAYQGQAWASALNNSQQQDESKLNAWDVPQQDRRGASVKPERPRPTAAPPPVASPAPRAGSTRSTTPSGRRRRRDAPAPFEVKKRSTFAADDEDDSEGSERRLPPRGGQDTDESPPSRRSDDPRAAGRRGAAVSEPSRSGRAAANGYPTPNRQTGGRGDGDRPNGGGIGGGGDGRKTAWEGNDSDDTASRRLDPTATEDWAWRKLENVDENIARALARRGIQQAKLREIGAVPPDTKISGGVQTESTVTTTSAAIARADVSDLRLVDDAAAAYKARQEHHPSNRTPPQPLLLMPMKPIERAEDAIPAQAFADPQADRNKVRAGLFDRQNVSARYDINTKLDQMQLADEELIVSHVKDTAREHDDYRRILEHVAIGNRQGEQVPAPLGGYLSTRDPAYSSQQDSSDAVERWRNAKFNNVVASTGEMAAAVATTQALRKYGAENAQATEKRASQPEVTFRRGAQQKAGYDARRKWSSVNFGLPTDGTNVDAAVATMDYEYRLAHAEAARQKLPQTGGGFVETNQLHPTATTDYGFLSSRTNETLDATHAQASSVYPVASGALRNRYDD